MRPIRLSPEAEAKTASDLATLVMAATDGQVAEKKLNTPENQADFLISTDALNYHRVEWRCREEWGEVTDLFRDRIAVLICKTRGYEFEEFDAALVATKHRPRLPFGWTALHLAIHRLRTRPVRFLSKEIESSRYLKGVLSLAVHLQTIQKDEPILLPVEQVREILKAKKVVIAGTLTKLVEMGLLEMTKAAYNTGSAREFRFKGVEGQDYVFEEVK